MKAKIIYPSLVLLWAVVFFLDVLCGVSFLPIQDLVNLIGNQEVVDNWSYIFWQYRLPKAITATLCGSALAIAGLLMQTYFRNPLAGPFVLGITSGAGLGVAIVLLGAGFLGGWLGILIDSGYGLVLAASLGSMSVMFLVMFVAIRIQDTMSLLIIGLMLGSLASAVVSVLSYFTDASQLQQYIFWGFGNLGNLSYMELQVLLVCVAVGIVLAFFMLKPLNAMLLGEAYAKSIGVQWKKSSVLILISASLLAGSVTAFAGPITFLGLIIPHIARQFFKTSNHKILLPITGLMGAIALLLCDILSNIFGNLSLPINVVTTLLGAPIVIWVLWRKKYMIF